MAFRIFKLFRNNKDLGILKDKDDSTSNTTPSDGIKFIEHDQYNNNNPSIKFYKDYDPNDNSWMYESDAIGFDTTAENTAINSSSTMKNKIITLFSNNIAADNRKIRFNKLIERNFEDIGNNPFGYLNSNRNQYTQY